MQVMTTLPQENLNIVPSAAKAAEDMGFDMLATMENKYEPFLPLAVAAVNTKKISLGTAVAIAFPRSPMVVQIPVGIYRKRQEVGLYWELDRRLSLITKNVSQHHGRRQLLG
tara:strand:- start:1298 stop:1633 length:336 start_codon:yes stop_codon:yes gene_type:complete